MKRVNEEFKKLPPGYTLEVNQSGKYRPVRNGRALYWLNGPGTKEEAIDRAWDQYEHENNWKKVTTHD